MGRERARNWYWWLWLSPLLTMPTLLVVAVMCIRNDWPAPVFYGWMSLDAASAGPAAAVCAISVLGAALWHLLLLVPSFDRQQPFVRWHGRQALALAGIRTVLSVVAVPAIAWLALGLGWNMVILGAVCLVAAVLAVPFWAASAVFGQLQAARGDCWLMRRTGHADLLAKLQRTDPPRNA